MGPARGGRAGRVWRGRTGPVAEQLRSVHAITSSEVTTERMATVGEPGCGARRVTAVLVAIGSALLAPCSAGPAVAATGPRPGALAPGSPECTANKAAGTVHFASPFGYDASAGIIDVNAAERLGYFADLCLRVEFIDVPTSASPYALVSADAAQITGEGSAADAIVEEADGSNFVGISTYGDTSDYALLTRAGITKLTQLEGKVLAYHTVLPVVLREMLVKAGANVSKVRLVQDPTYDPLLLVHGSFDALEAYQSNEPITLRADHEPFTMWTPAQFGISSTFNVQVANRKFLASHRGAVADFLRAEFRAFGYCTAHAATCVGYLAEAQGPTFNLAHGEAEWRVESALALDHHLAGRGIGVETVAEWAPEAAAVLRYKLVRKPVDLAGAEDTSLAGSLYRGTRLVWP
jgi:putative hydroxymethylpyrimidine transport system substrate-binding protein